VPAKRRQQHQAGHTGGNLPLTIVLLCLTAPAQSPSAAEATDATVPIDQRALIQAMQARAHQGDAQAQFDLATAYDSGHAVATDPARAAYWYRRAARQQHALAQFNLGVALEDGLTGQPDPRQARHCYQQAAAQGLPEAQSNLGRLWASDALGETRVDLERQWFTTAAAQHHAPALYNLGV